MAVQRICALPSIWVTHGCFHDYGRLQLVTKIVILSALLTCLLSYSTRSKINQPLSFKFFSHYLAATACILCIHTITTFIQTSSPETGWGWVFYLHFSLAVSSVQALQEPSTQFIFHRLCFVSSLSPPTGAIQPIFKIFKLTAPKLSNTT